MSESYEKKLDEFVDGKSFSRLPHPVRDRADVWCDACGSLEPRLLFGLKEEGTGRYFFVGSECLKEISLRGVIRKGFCRQSAEVAFREEMARRRVDSPFIGESIELVTGIECPDGTLPYSTVTPHLNFFQTDESYIALFQIWYEGALIWGSGQVPRLIRVWEPNGGSGLILKQVPRDPADAMAECARIASEQALAVLEEHIREQSNQTAPAHCGCQNNHDWTGFWKAVKDMGLDREGVVQLADGLMPWQWLERHPEQDLEDLLDMLRWKWEQGLSLHPAISLVEAS
jgi:hypothetical protein